MTRDPTNDPAKPGEAPGEAPRSGRGPAKPDEARSLAKPREAPDEAWRSVATKRYEAQYNDAPPQFRILARGTAHYEALDNEARQLWTVAKRLYEISATTFNHWCRHIKRGEAQQRENL